jgi:hypothetical protein
VSCANLYDDDARPDAVTASAAPYDPGDPWLARVDAEDVAFPRAGRPGHGCTAVLRRQPARIAGGRVEDGYACALEIICCDCGDNPYLDYSQLSPRLQKIRGPYAIAAGLTVRTRPTCRRESCPSTTGDTKVGEGRIKTQPGMFSLASEGLCVGRDSGEPVTDDYPGPPPHAFTGGTIKRVAVDVSGDPYIDLEREAQAMLARE